MRKSARVPHALAFTRVRPLLTVAARHGVDARHLPFASALLAVNAACLPLRLLDHALSRREVAATPIQPPVFVVGFWRSGTTRLHNLLAADPRFGALRMLHVVAPESFLGARRLIGGLTRPFLPESRRFDGVAVGLDEPQEEEFAMARATAMSQFHAFCFPRRMREIVDRWVTFETASDADVAAWSRAYDRLLRRVAIDEGGRPLVLKSPGHAARIDVLRRLYPDARFIHVHRDPYEVFRSNLKMWQAMIADHVLQNWNADDPQHEAELSHNLTYFYGEIMRRCFEHSACLPANRFAEVRFADLERDPLGELERVYKQLDLPDWNEAAPRMQEYVGQTATYRRDGYPEPGPDFAPIREAWDFAYKRLGYS